MVVLDPCPWLKGMERGSDICCCWWHHSKSCTWSLYIFSLQLGCIAARHVQNSPIYGTSLCLRIHYNEKVFVELQLSKFLSWICCLTTHDLTLLQLVHLELAILWTSHEVSFTINLKGNTVFFSFFVHVCGSSWYKWPIIKYFLCGIHSITLC